MTLLVVQAAATWFMVGLIWTIQVVHYPLFPLVGNREFAAYEAGRTRRIGHLLVVPAVTEIATAAALPWMRPATVPLWLTLVSGVLLAALWIMTALVQAPLHGRLSTVVSRDDMNRLVRSNWWRTVLWTARGLLVAVMLLL